MAALPDGVLAAIRGGMGGLRCATGNDVVGNDECAYSFDSPWGGGGLFVSLKTFRGCGADFVVADAAKQNCALYAHHAWRKVPRAKAADASEPSVTPAESAEKTRPRRDRPALGNTPEPRSAAMIALCTPRPEAHR
jgi:hypothetical protein